MRTVQEAYRDSSSVPQKKTVVGHRKQTYANRLHYSRLILFTILYNLPSTRECTSRPLYVMRIREGTDNAE